MGIIGSLKNLFTKGSIYFDVYNQDSNSFLDLRLGESALYSYIKCPPLSNALGLRINAFKTAQVKLINEDGEELQDPLLTAKLKKPNAYENYDSLRGKVDFYVRLFGWCIIYAESKVIGSNPLKATSWHVISPMNLDPVYSNPSNKKDFSNKIIGFNTLSLSIKFIAIQDCLLLKSNNPDPYNNTLALSDILLVEQNISNVILANEVRNSILVNRGAVGIMSSSSKEIQQTLIPKLKDEIETVKKQYYKNYGLTHGKSPLIFTNMPLKFDRIQWNVDELKLYEENQESSERIYDALDVPGELKSSSNQSTFDNQSEYRKRLYVEAVIPADNDFYSSLTSWLGYDNAGLEVVSTYEHLDVFQENEKEKAEAQKAQVEANMPLYEKKLITKNQMLLASGYEAVAGGDSLNDNTE